MGNMFKCVLASGTGNGIPLIVTCASAFAGLTITCTDGTTTLTDTCPSASPYEITFELPNVGSWEVSGTISGETFRESILIQDFDIELNNYVDITVDVYSAANDTVSYVGVDSQTHTITTDSSGHASATITIKPSGSALTFTSSVAKEPSDLSSYYSKTITLTSATTSVYVMPDGEVMYWWGYISDNVEVVNSANGWSVTSGGTAFKTPTYNTNNIELNGGTSTLCGIGKKTTTAFTGTHHLISKGETYTGLVCTTGANKAIIYEGPTTVIVPSSYSTITHQQATYNGSCNVFAHGRKASSNRFTMYAWWVETT
jgi:hypothetical protein